MLSRNSTGLALAGAILLAAGGAILAGQGTGTTQEKQEKVIKKVPITHSRPDSGEQMYKDYCAVCHGAEGKGNGPAAEYLKSPLPDLTMMTMRNNGKFPAEHVQAILRFGTESKAHGTVDMPLWGPLFRAEDRNVDRLRISNLTKYLESIQGK